MKILFLKKSTIMVWQEIFPRLLFLSMSLLLLILKETIKEELVLEIMISDNMMEDIFL
jgi:hypothetical protein